MFSWLFGCRGCRAKDAEIRYLRASIDKLHEKIGIASIVDPEPKLREDFAEKDEMRDEIPGEYEVVGG